MHVGNVANAKTRKNSALQIKFEKDLLRKYSTCLSVSLSLCVYRSNLISKEIKTSDIKKVEKPSRRWCCGALCFVLFLLFLYCFFCVYVSRRMRLVCRERWRRIESQSNDSNCDKLLYLLSNVLFLLHWAKLMPCKILRFPLSFRMRFLWFSRVKQVYINIMKHHFSLIADRLIYEALSFSVGIHFSYFWFIFKKCFVLCILLAFTMKNRAEKKSKVCNARKIVFVFFLFFSFFSPVFLW